MKIKTTINNGIMSKDDLIRLLEAIKKQNGDITIEIKKTMNKRSIDQNKYYWGVVLDILSKETGECKDELHEMMKYKFLGCDNVSVLGEEFYSIKSTSGLGTVEFEDFLSSIREWASIYLNCYIPLPNEPYPDI